MDDCVSDDTIDGQQHSLDGWCAIRPDLFNTDDQTRAQQRLRFLVAANHLSDTIGITCLEDTRRATDKRTKSMAVSIRYLFLLLVISLNGYLWLKFSVEELLNINKQLSLIRPTLDHYFEPIAQLIQSRDSTSRLYSLIMGFMGYIGFG